MSEWKEYKLEELTISKGCYGIGAPAIPYAPNKHKYLRITDINDDGTLNRDSMMSVDDKNADNYILKKNDIVFARTGNSTGRTYFYDGSDGKLVYAGFLIKFSLNEEKVNPRILKYYTHSKPYYDWVNSFDTGGTRGNINAKTYGAMPIVLPSRKVQDKIISILKPLDDKIELNHRINENLEQQAQALFKHWFVDFAPFKDNNFIESEIGMIPKGWRVGTIDEIAKFKRGKTITEKDIQIGNIPVVAGGKRPAYYHSEYNAESPVVTISASGANAGFMRMYHENIWASDCSYIDKSCANIYWIYCFLANNKQLLKHAQTGAVQPHVKASDVNKFVIKIPPMEIIKKFEIMVKRFFDDIGQNLQESRLLENLRDTLLPKLMSGELNIDE